MPRIAIISDIHANSHALEAVIEDAKLCECSGFVCLGDVVGYNAYPSKCIRAVRKLRGPSGEAECPVVPGNHDVEVAYPSKMIGVSSDAIAAIQWTRGKLSEDDLTWLRSLSRPRRIFPWFSVVHASLESPMRWKYVLDTNDAFDSMVLQKETLCFHGHTHIPKVFFMKQSEALNQGNKPIPFALAQQRGQKMERPSSANAQLYDMGEELSVPLVRDGMVVVPIQEGYRYFINVGSVGQPRDGCWRPCYAYYDSDIHSVVFRRPYYDVDAAIQAVRDTEELPLRLAERLRVGE